MANAGFGNLVGNFLQAFTQSKMLKQRSDEQEEEREARLKLYELQLKHEQERSAAEQRVRSQMGGAPLQMPNITENPGELGGFNIGPRTPGTARGPKPSLLQLLTNPESLMDMAQSGMLPEITQMVAATRPSGGGSMPESLQLMAAAGIDPASPEGRQLAMNRIGGNDNGLQALQAQMLALQAAQAQATLDDRNRTRTATEAAAKSSTRSLLRNAAEMADINERLEGTVMQTGLPMEELRRGAAGVAPLLEKFGMDMSATQRAVGDYDRFKKLSEQMVIDLLPKLVEAGTITDTKYESLQRTLASTAVSPEANRLVTADVIDMGLESADKLGLSLEDREMLEALSQSLRTPRAATGGSSGPKQFTWDPQTRRLVPKQ
jgi:hypothetical protein